MRPRRVSSRHDNLRASALRGTDKMVALCRHELATAPGCLSVCFRDPLTACPCTGCPKQQRPQPRVSLRLRGSGLRLTARVQSKPNRPLRSKPWDSSVDCLGMSVPSTTMFPSPRPDSPHFGGIRWPRRHRERAPGEGRRQGGGVPEPRVGRCSARASAAVMPAWFEFFVLNL